MSDRSEDRPEERRRTGPLGNTGDEGETRREPPEGSDAGATRRVPNRPFGTSERGEAQETEAVPKKSPDEAEDKETRVIRTPPRRGASAETADATPYPRGYFEAADEREDRLRDMFGGVDWLASFLGFVFVAVVGALFSLVAGLVLAPLGFSPDLGGGEFGAAVITGLVLVAVLIFLAYFFGGYVAGRLARFDGGRNGAMLLLWTFIAVALLVLAGGVFGGFLPGGFSEAIQNNVLSTIGGLSELGLIGVLVAAGALLAAFLGGILGGRLGSRYHAEIDRTT